jgi:hypothetical protein
VANVSRQPKELTPEEKRLADAKRWEEKMRQDYFNSVKQHPSFEERVAAEKAKKAAEDAAKQQAQAESALKWAIDSFECYSRPNRADWLRTNQFRADLRKIEVRVNGKRCAVRTLAAVREANRARKPGLARWPWHSGHDPVPARSGRDTVRRRCRTALDG